MLTQLRIKELFSYSPETGLFTRLVSTNRQAKAGTVAGTPDGAGYLRVSIDHKRYRAHRLAWLFVYGTFPSYEIDHINRVRGDNRIANLRAVDKSENQQNTSISTRNTSGAKGVFWSAGAANWQAQICIKGHKIHLGCFACLADAKAAYLVAATQHHTHTMLPKRAKED